MTPLEKERIKFLPKSPAILKHLTKIKLIETKTGEPEQDQAELKKLFPHSYGKAFIAAKGTSSAKDAKPLKVGVVFSGGQASGGHNVISGLFDALRQIHPDSHLIGFLNGPSGIINNQTKPLDEKAIASYRNTGGFDLIGSGRTKIEKSEDLQSSLKTANQLALDGIVIVGGDDSNTNAAVLAEYFLANKCCTKVVGVPKTIDGDLRSEDVEITFGFDTACKIYSELISNLQRDALSAKKYYHFIKLMGRSASHIALECALRTHPNFVLIGEEIQKQNLSLADIVNKLADIIEKRAAMGKNFGVFLIPEGLIEFIPELNELINELNHQLANIDLAKLATFDEQKKQLLNVISTKGQKTYNSLPEDIQKQLILERDPHGNIPVSLIETEKLLSLSVQENLKKRSAFKGKFNPLHHFFGYEGRCGFPSDFDATYCYNLGKVAALLLFNGVTGYMSCVNHLTAPVEKWEVLGIPLVALMNMEVRKGKNKPVIKKTLVNLKGKPFQVLHTSREKWANKDDYQFCGPIQFYGNENLVEGRPLILNN